MLKEALVITRNALGPNNPALALRLNNLGNLLLMRVGSEAAIHPTIGPLLRYAIIGTFCRVRALL